jgi:hypothetical protein
LNQQKKLNKSTLYPTGMLVQAFEARTCSKNPRHSYGCCCDAYQGKPNWTKRGIEREGYQKVDECCCDGDII